MSDEQKEMSFWDHIDELRKILFRIAVVVIVVAIAMFMAMPWQFDNVILAPTHADFPLYRFFDAIVPPESGAPAFEISLININLAAQLFTHLSMSGWSAAVVCFPIIISMLWSFISQGLYPEEKKNARVAFLFGNAMFYLGVAVGYFLVFPLTLRFLATYQLSATIENTLTLESYMDNFLAICLIMGLVFELPLLAWLLGKFHILTKGFFTKFRRHAIVALLIAAALITPTGDPFTLFLVFIPIYSLWEFSSFLVPAEKKEDVQEAEE